MFDILNKEQCEENQGLKITCMERDGGRVL